ncbi:MAG: apolipoprotein N-acyltransferase [Gammaproteobacteria bacterium]|nr:apolipoprotein N-acyltransferase [Gammaproteobacteria bacterium]
MTAAIPGPAPSRRRDARALAWDAGVVAAGAAGPLAFSPFELWPAAVLSLAVLFLAWLPATPGRAARRGWLYGAGMLGTGVFWIHESFQFQHVALPLAVVLTGLLVMAMALYPALTGWLVTRLPAGAAVRLLVLFPVAWTLQEWLRSWLFTGFPWLMAGYAQVDGPFRGLAPVTGVLGVTALTALAAGALAALVARPRRPAAPLAVLGAIALAGWLAHGVPWTTPTGDTLRVALVQGNVPQDQKWLPERRRPTMDHYLNATRAHGDADLIIWPETAIPALYHEVRPFLAGLEEQAKERGQALILGIPYLDAGSGLLHNSVVTLAPGERLYHKRHLVPFGEFVPWRDVLEPPMRALNLPLPTFRPGPQDQAPARVAGHAVAVSVCYEGAFGELARRDLPRAELLVNLTNDAWFGRSIGPPQHFQMARMRALESGRPLLRATNTGITAIIGPRGEIRARIPQFQTAVLRGQVQPMAGATPYVRWGQWPVVALALIVLVMAGWRWRWG